MCSKKSKYFVFFLCKLFLIKLSSRGGLLTDKHHHHHHRHHCHRCSDEIIRCPHHVALPDGEWNQSYSNLQFRNSYQVSTHGLQSFQKKKRNRKEKNFERLLITLVLSVFFFSFVADVNVASGNNPNIYTCTTK